MSRRGSPARTGGVVLLAAVLLCAGSRPAAADADQEIARRLVALRSLSSPSSAPRPRVGRVEPSGRCGPGDAASFWRRGYALRARVDGAVRDASLRYGVDAALIRSVIRHESNGDPDAVSHKGAMGLMQLMPGTAGDLGVVCPFDPRENVLAGTRYLRFLRDRLGSWPRAVAGYHAGPGRVESGTLPAETRRYVERVLGTWTRRR